VYVSSALFVAAWGVFQFACNITGGEYPYFIFNNSANEVAQGYASIILDLSEATFRVTSVATEASVMAQFLIPVLPVVVFALLLKQPILSPFLDFVTVVAIIAVLLVSTSSTAYLGLVLCAMAVLIVLVYLRRAGFGVWLSYVVVIGTMVMGYVSIDFFRTAADFFVLDKLATGSGIERLLTVEYAWEYFLKYPILGVGWGSAPSNDLVVNLLANAGILGLVTFAALAGYVIVRLAGAVVSSRRTHVLRKTTLAESRSLAILVAFLLILALQATGGIQYGYAYFWLTLGLAIAAPSILQVTISPIRHSSVSRLRAAAP
jgi:O-antigen ligase